MRELKPPKPEAVWLAASDIAERLKVSRSAAYAIMRRLPRYREGRITRVSEEVFAAYLATRMIAPGPAPPRAIDAGQRQAIERLAWVEGYQARQLARKKKPAAPPSVPAGSQLNESTVERLTRPTRPRTSGQLAGKSSKGEP